MKQNKGNKPYFRILLLIALGLMNTVFIKDEDIGNWKNYLGYAFLLWALIEIFMVIKRKT